MLKQKTHSNAFITPYWLSLQPDVTQRIHIELVTEVTGERRGQRGSRRRAQACRLYLQCKCWLLVSYRDWIQSELPEFSIQWRNCVISPLLVWNTVINSHQKHFIYIILWIWNNKILYSILYKETWHLMTW